MIKNIFILVTCFFYSSFSYAFKFSPMSATLNYKPNENTSLFYLENDSTLPIAIQISIATRTMDINGIEKNIDVKNDFDFYPSQVIIPANEKRSVKVTYLGKTRPQNEIAYRLIAEQLPIDLEKSKKNKKSIKVLLRYVAALYVSDDDFKSDIEVKSILVTDKNVSVTLDNKGTKHQVLSDLKLNFLNDKLKKEIMITQEDLKGASGENILAKSERIFSFVKKGNFLNIQQTDKVKVSFDKD